MKISETVALLVLGGAITAWALFTAWGISWWRETREYREMLKKFKRQLQREYDADFTLAETASILLNYGLAEPHLGERNNYEWVPEVVADAYERLKAAETRLSYTPAEDSACKCASCAPPAKAETPPEEPEEPASLRTRLDQFERAAVAYDIRRRPGIASGFKVLDETSQVLAKAENGLLGSMRTIGMPEIQWRPWVDALRKACETYAHADEGYVMDGVRADIARIKTRIIELHEREWLKARDPQVFALLAEYRAAAIGATFASPGMRQTELAVAEADLYDKLVALVAPKPAAPTVVSLTFAQLREASLKRCPLFRNAKGELCHPNGVMDWSPDRWMTALVGEVGEAANDIKKVNRGDLSLEEALPKIGSEIADAQTYLDLLAARLNLSLAEITINKFNEVSRRIGCDVFLGETA